MEEIKAERERSNAESIKKSKLEANIS